MFKIKDTFLKQLFENVFSNLVGLVLTSFGWWENFVSDGSSPAFRWMHGVRMRMIKKTRYRFYLVITVWKCVLFGAGTMVAVTQNGLVSNWRNLFEKFEASFDRHDYTLTETIRGFLCTCFTLVIFTCSHKMNGFQWATCRM